MRESVCERDLLVMIRDSLFYLDMEHVLYMECILYAVHLALKLYGYSSLFLSECRDSSCKVCV